MDEDKRRSWQAGIDRLKTVTIDERLRAAADQRRIALEFLKGGLRARFSHLTEDEIESKVGEIVFGSPVWRDICDRRRRCLDGH